MDKIIDGLNVHYTLSGTGSLIVLLHGWGSNIKPFNDMIELMQTDYSVLALDLPGFGLSDEPKEPWDVDKYTDFVIKFIAGFNYKNIIILGHSFGGRLIIKISNRQDLPFVVEKIILADSAGIKPKKSFKSKISLYVYKTMRFIFSISFIKKIAPHVVENMRKKRGSADYQSASPIMRQCLVKVINEDLTPLLKNIKAPTLIIWGEDDIDTPISDAILMEQLIPDAGLVKLKNAGHYSFIDQKYTFNKVISSYLNIKE